MKKKLLAMCLVLALALSMMVPVFAAVGDTVSPRACNHSWSPAGPYSVYMYTYVDYTCHLAHYSVPANCLYCTATTTLYGNYSEGHTVSCSKCM